VRLGFLGGDGGAMMDGTAAVSGVRRGHCRRAAMSRGVVNGTDVQHGWSIDHEGPGRKDRGNRATTGSPSHSTNTIGDRRSQRQR
jgi:hypothetical protein